MLYLCIAKLINKCLSVIRVSLSGTKPTRKRQTKTIRKNQNGVAPLHPRYREIENALKIALTLSNNNKSYY